MGARYEVTVIGHARQAMREIAIYIARERSAPGAAARLLRLFDQEIMSLQDMPARIPLAPDRTLRTMGIRRMVVENYYIYIRIDESSHHVMVLDVIHVKRRPLQRLSDLLSRC